MAIVIEQEFYLSEILGRRVFVKKKRIGRLSDLAIIETGKLPEVTQVVVSRPFGYPPLTVPWDRVRLISNQEIVLDIGEDVFAQFERAPQENLNTASGSHPRLKDSEYWMTREVEEVVHDGPSGSPFRTISCMRRKSTSVTTGRCAGLVFASLPNCSRVANRTIECPGCTFSRCRRSWAASPEISSSRCPRRA